MPLFLFTFGSYSDFTIAQMLEGPVNPVEIADEFMLENEHFAEKYEFYRAEAIQSFRKAKEKGESRYLYGRMTEDEYIKQIPRFGEWIRWQNYDLFIQWLTEEKGYKLVEFEEVWTDR